MAILDKQLEFDPAATAITVTAPSTNIIDLGVGRDLGVIGEGIAPHVVVYAQSTFTAGGAATLTIQFQGAPDNGSGAPGTYVTFAEIPTLSIAELNTAIAAGGGKLMDIVVPRRRIGAVPPRFYRLNYVVATGPFTGGTVQAEYTLGVQDQTAYPSGIVINN